MAKSKGISEITILLDGKKAEHTMEVLTKHLEVLVKERDKLNAQGIWDKDESDRLKELDREIRQTTGTIKNMKQQTMDIGDVISNIANVSEKDLKRALQNLTNQTAKLDRTTKEYAENKKNIAALRAELDKTKSSAIKADSGLSQIGQTMKRLASYVLVYAGFNELVNGIQHLISVNAELSDQYADISKTTGLEGNALRGLAKDIRNIDTRTPVEQLNNLAYTAGKLGIQGRDNILEFVKAGNQINVALGEELGEDAIQNIAKLNDVLGITKQLGVERSLLATGSAINELGQTSTANEGYLVDFAQRMGGIAKQAGLTIQQILALGSASDQMGQNVEVSATALNKVLTTLVSQTDQVAKAIGVTYEELSAALNESTWNGLMLVFEKLAGKGGLAAIAPLMGELGSDGARLNAVVSSLTSNLDVMNTALATSNKAFAEATSLTEETMKREESLMGIWQRAMKNVTKIFQDSKINDQLKDIAVYIYRVTGEFDEFGNRIGGAISIFASLTKILAQFVNFLIRNIDSIAMFAASFVSVKVAITGAQLATKAYEVVLTTLNARHAAARTFLLLWNSAVALLSGNLTKATAAFKLFRTAIATNPLGAAVTAFATLGTAIYTIYRRSTEAAREYKRFKTELNENIAAERSQAEYLFSVAQKSAAGTEERRKAIADINAAYSQYLPNLIKETASQNDLADALKTVNSELQNSIALKMKQEEIQTTTRQSLTSQMSYIDQMNAASKTTDEMNSRMLERINNLLDVYIGKGKSVGELMTIISSDLLDTFGSAGKQGGDYWEAMEGYIRETIAQRKKLAEIDARYAPWSPKEKENTNVLPEVVVTATGGSAPGEATDKAIKDRIEKDQAAIDLWLQQKKNALSEARLAEQDANSESYISQEEYNRAVEALEMEAMRKRLAILGLEPNEVAKIEGQILDIRRQFMEKTEGAQKKWADEYDKLQTQLGIRAEDKDKQNLARINVLYDTLIEKAKEGVKENYKSQEEITDDIRKFEEQRQKAINKYYGNKDLEHLDEEEAKEAVNIRERFINREMDYEEYQRQMNEMELQYAEVRTHITDVEEAKKAELVRRYHEQRFKSAKQSYDKEKRLQQQYATVIQSSLEGIGGAFAQLASGSENSMEQMRDAIVDTLFDTLTQMVDIWLTELGITATASIAQGTMKEIGSKGLIGLATGAAITGIVYGLLAVAKSAIKSALKGKSGNTSSGSTGQRVVKTSGFRVGGFTGEGPTYEVAGVVHRGEYIVPKWQMYDPISFNMVRALDAIRQTRSHENILSVHRNGYAEGGLVQTPMQTISMQPNDPQMLGLMQEMYTLLSSLRHDGVKTVFSVSRLEQTQARLNASRLRGSLKK